MSVLQAIERQERIPGENPLVNRVLQTCQEILSGNEYITFCWIASPRDITGNEEADRAAKDALSKNSFWTSMYRCFYENPAICLVFVAETVG